jgi:Tol biopolymer transport system component
MGAVLVWSGIGLTQHVSEPEVRLQEALHKEQAEGDLAGAIKLYERVAADRQAPRPVAAQALLNAGRCYEKLRRREAQNAYERIVTQFTDQGAIAAQARARLAAMLADPKGASAGLSSTKLRTFATVNSTNVSVDGRFTIASEGRGLNIVELTTGERRRILSDPWRIRGGRRACAISPDGKQIAYFAAVNGVPGLRLASPGESNPRVVPLVSPSQRTNRGMIPVDWSRDGRRIAAIVFWQDTRSETGRDALADIAIVDIATGNMRVLDSALTAVGSQVVILPQRVRFSPDGEYLAFDVRRSTQAVLTAMPDTTTSAGDIFTVRADGSGAERLSIGTGAAELYGWLPDGKAIVFAREVGGLRSVWAVPVEGGRARGTPVVLMRGVGQGEPEGITTSGSLIYTVDGSTVRSYTVDLSRDAGRRTSVDDSGYAAVSNVSWSPDGRYQSYVVASRQNRPVHRLRIRELTSGKVREILIWEGGLGRSSSWSPDGQSVLLVRSVASEGGVNRIDKVNISTGAVELLTQIPAMFNFPRMSPDGGYLYALINWGMVRIDLRTKERVTLGTVAEPAFDLTADGKRLAFVAREGASFVLKVQSTDGGEEQLVLRLRPDERINSIAWKPGSDSIFLAKQNAETIQLFELDTRAASGPVPLGIFIKTWADISVHPDGRQLAFYDAEWLTEFWRIDGLSEAFAAAVRASTGSSGMRPRPGRSN